MNVKYLKKITIVFLLIYLFNPAIKNFFLKDDIVFASVSSAYVDSKVEQLRNKFPNGKYWNHLGGANNDGNGWTNTACTHHRTTGCDFYGSCGCNSFNNAIQCMGFAFKIGNEIFGDNVRNWRQFYDWNSVKKGDYIRINNNYGGHSMIVLAKDEQGVSVVECNIGGNCQIRWDQWYSKSGIMSQLAFFSTSDQIHFDTISPIISEVKITDHTSEGYTVTCRVTDASGVTKVMFPTWTEANGQDDLMGGNNWENMPGLCGATNGEYATFRVHDSDHSYEKGRYNTHIYAWDQYGNRAGPVTLAVDLAIKNEPVAVTYFQGNKYMLMEDAFGWKDAKSKCEKLGGHLVTITSESEQNIVADLLKKGQRISYAMGMTDENEEGVYKWVTGEKYSFSNWAPSEPNNHNNNENASLIYNKSGYGGEQIAYHGSWNDTAISTITGYICEIENDKKASATVNWNGHNYTLYEDLLTWDEAQKRCKELGGHLVTITSQEEQDAVIDLQKKGKKENYYIGLSDTSQEGNFQWVTGETTNFSLWESGQPDNWQGNENYVHLMPDGKWNDVERNQRYGFICEYDGMESSPQIMYQTHTEGFGWLNWVTDGAMSGTTGEGRRVEAVKIQATESNLGVRYRTWVSSRGWTNWSEDGALSGTEGSGLPVEAIDIELMGADKDKYDLYYKTHTGNFGWLDWAKNGQHAGTLGYGYQIEALEIVLIPKNGTPPGRTDVPLKSQNYVEPPVISDIKVTNRSRSGYTVSCKVSSEIGIKKIMFPTWTVTNGQDDLSDNWPSMPEYQGTTDQNTITFHVNAGDHNNEQGFYSTHIYAWDENGGVTKAFLDPVLVSVAANKGDLNADGKVDIMDARKAKRAAMKEITLSESEFAAADLNGDGKVDIMEARKIKRAAMKEITLN